MSRMIGRQKVWALALTMLWVATVAATPTVLGWDSQNWNPTHATHSYLTEWAIDQLKGQWPELQQYRTPLVDGANAELHELKVKGTQYGVDLEAKRVEHKGT